MAAQLPLPTQCKLSSLAQADKEGAMGDKRSFPLRECFALISISQPPKVKLITLTVLQAATLTFSVQKILLCHRLRLPTFAAWSHPFIFLLQLELKKKSGEWEIL